jgi:hypothetical protein
MVVLQVQVADFSLLDNECDPPIAGCRNAPGSRPVAGELMDPPPRRTLDAFHIRSGDHRGQDIPDSVNQIVPDAAGIIILDEAFQAAMTNASDSHVY